MTTDTRPWITLPYTAFDLETTGIDVAEDRIVTAAIIHITPGQEPVRRQWLLNPDRDIPESATEVHGITTEFARANGQHYGAGYDEIRQELDMAWYTGRLVIAFNASFDLGMMHHQGLRLAHEPLTPGAVFDPYVVDRMLTQKHRSRKLEPSAQHHRVRLDNAHDAEADALAAARITYRLREHPALRGRSVAWLMAAQQRTHRTHQEHLAEYFTSKGQDASDVDPHWPIRGVDTQPVDASTFTF